jgi:putative ABC transport system substrate-binding protein
MRRRKFITLVGAGALWPLAVHAQQPERMRRVAVLLGLGEKDPEGVSRAKAFRQGMRDLGWIEGRNVQIEYRFAGSNLELIDNYVVELIKLAPDVIVANGTAIVAALRSATSTIPIVAAPLNDPVGQGFVSSLAHPGGNITGFALIEPEMVGKWVDLLGDVKPDLSQIALMFNPDTTPYWDAFLRSFKASARKTSTEVKAAPVRSTAEVELAIAKLGREPGSGLIAAPDPFIIASRGAIVKAADEVRLPVIWPYKQFVIEGGLMSYGPDSVDIFRRSSSYVNRILKGESPADLPVQSPEKYELAVNLRTAKALGLSIRESFLLLADEVIE